MIRSELLKKARRIVIKLGTGILTNAQNQPDVAQLEQLVGQISALRKEGREVILVSSGAVGAGMGSLGLRGRPKDLADLLLVRLSVRPTSCNNTPHCLAIMALESGRSFSLMRIYSTMIGTSMPETLCWPSGKRHRSHRQ